MAKVVTTNSLRDDDSFDQRSTARGMSCGEDAGGRFIDCVQMESMLLRVAARLCLPPMGVSGHIRPSDVTPRV